MIVDMFLPIFPLYRMTLEGIIINTLLDSENYEFANDGSSLTITRTINGEQVEVVFNGQNLNANNMSAGGTFSSITVKDDTGATAAHFTLPGDVQLSDAVNAAFNATEVGNIPPIDIDPTVPGGLYAGEDASVLLALDIFNVLLIQFAGFIQILTGSFFDDVVNSYPVDDSIATQGGDDTVRLSDGNDTIDGGEGTDTADGRTLEAGMTFGITSANFGTAGINASFSLNNIEALIGTEYADIIYLAPGGPSLAFGDDGNDFLYAGNISTGVALHGNDGNDTVQGDAGNDTLSGGEGINQLDGQGGDDTVLYTWATGRVLLDFQTDVSSAGFARFYDNGASQGDTYANIEHAVGGDFADNLRGDGADNRLEGGGVSDRLYGRAGNDTLDGGAGADAIYGNLGADIMTGGPGAVRDRFIYFQANESGVGPGNRDIITDFTPGEDRIELSRIDADISQGFKQRFDFIGDAAFSNTAGELRFEQQGGITVVQADRDGDGVADFEIELTGTLTLTATDFLI
ncbi:calcium-binding protein [Pseudaestuariivita atlantica]|uniref:Peptidase M10 serralysin C-terminal domain-containing protein n=1 Tax=Pseudaestuariivita atlantica TaxID=1317121 RepID=A0A0L1JNE0_9RHOB|nr:calcium-binding protein [Pseudaestuariivita atlantica]KNG92918.1 hypothetical protein ATO11_15835 [Pseudaestuariivita atlantica]